MLVFRATKKIASRLRISQDNSSLPGTNLLGDWYVNMIIVQRKHLLLLASEQTLLPILIPAKELSSFPTRFNIALFSILQCLEIPMEKIQLEMENMSSWQIAKTANRQVLGSMNDFTNMLKMTFDESESLMDHALRLAESPCSPIGMDSPIEATKAIFLTEKISSVRSSAKPPTVRLVSR